MLRSVHSINVHGWFWFMGSDRSRLYHIIVVFENSGRFVPRIIILIEVEGVGEKVEVRENL